MKKLLNTFLLFTVMLLYRNIPIVNKFLVALQGYDRNLNATAYLMSFPKSDSINFVDYINDSNFAIIVDDGQKIKTIPNLSLYKCAIKDNVQFIELIDFKEKSNGR